MVNYSQSEHTLERLSAIVGFHISDAALVSVHAPGDLTGPLVHSVATDGVPPYGHSSRADCCSQSSAASYNPVKRREQTMQDRFHLAVEAFSTADSIEALWLALNHHLAAFGFTGILYGTEAMPGLSNTPHSIMNSIDSEWLTEKLDKDLFNCDEYVRVARIDPMPILWKAPENLPNITAAARRSLLLDYDYRIITGVTVPMHFYGMLGRSSIGCHAAGMSLAAFSSLWQEHQATIAMIVNAFDATLRQRFGMEMFGLTPDERSCLSYLTVGLRPKQISERMRRTDKQVRGLMKRAQGRLKSHTVEQALATALVYGLITP